MPFLNGQISFARLGVASTTGGAGPTLVGQAQLDAFAEQILVPGEIGAGDEIERGWCAGGHVFDERFSIEHNCFAGGSVMHAALRIDTNRVPSEIKRAIKSQHETALRAESDDGNLSRAERRDLRDLVDQAMHHELASGKHRRSAMVPALWDAERQTVLLATSANAATEQVCALWRETFDSQLTLTPMSAGPLAYAYLSQSGRSRDFEDAACSAFTSPPPHAEGEGETNPRAPWAFGGPEPHDFLGNEMLIWLWHKWDTGEADIDVRLPAGGASSLSIAFDRSLEMQCAWGVTGKQSLRADPEGPSPIRSPEAANALAMGKWPRKAGLLIADETGSFWKCTLAADRWSVTGVALPDPPEEIEDPRELIEWRIDQTRRIDERLLGLFHAFLDERFSPSWPSTRGKISAWIKERRAPRRPMPGAQVEAMPAPASEPV